MTSDARESFTEEVTFELSVHVCGKGWGLGGTPKQRHSAIIGKGL